MKKSQNKSTLLVNRAVEIYRPGITEKGLRKMKVLGKNTKRAQSLIWSYEHSKYETLDEAYKSCSQEKKVAYWNIVREMKQFDGYGLRITGKSCNFFSCAYLVHGVSQETGECGYEVLVYHTYANTYIMTYK